MPDPRMSSPTWAGVVAFYKSVGRGPKNIQDEFALTKGKRPHGYFWAQGERYEERAANGKEPQLYILEQACD